MNNILDVNQWNCDSNKFKQKKNELLYLDEKTKAKASFRQIKTQSSWML